MPRSKKAGRLSKKNKTIAKAKVEEGEKSDVPHSFIIHKGKVGRCLRTLEGDFRKVMEPNTAVKLKEKNSNRIRDFVALSGPMNVKHLIIFTRTSVGVYMKMSRMPRGPSITFRLNSYCLSKDIISNLKKQMTYATQFNSAPCLMTNLQPNSGDNELQLVCRMFLDLFPTITPNETKLSTLRRCCLLNYDTEKKLFDFRHYSIKIVPVGVSKAVKKLTKRAVPDLSQYKDYSEFISKAGLLSDSEGEDDANANVEIDEKMFKKRNTSNKSSIRLTELGPRISLTLVKIEEGLFGGTVLHHNIVEKTEEEKLRIEKMREKKKRLKEKRKKEQKDNIEKKKQQQEDHKVKCGAKAKVKDGDEAGAEKSFVGELAEMDDDAKYYMDEVGEKPDADLFTKSTKRKSDDHERPIKRLKKMQEKKLKKGQAMKAKAQNNKAIAKNNKIMKAGGKRPKFSTKSKSGDKSKGMSKGSKKKRKN